MTARQHRSTDADPFLLEILQKSFDSIADDMALILIRTSYSGIVRDAMDFSTGVCDAEGQTLAQGVTIPMHLGSFYDAMRCMIDQYQGQIYPGDVFISNDPYVAAGVHLPDIYIIKPIFADDKLIGWGTTIAHHSDVGGIVAGSNSLGAAEIYQEGLRIPVIKFLERGQRNQAVWDLIATNVRTPDQVMGDLQAQMAAVTTAEREIQQLVGRYGLDVVTRYSKYLHDYAERLARAQLRDVPDGTYRFTNHMDGLGDDPEPIALTVAVTFEADHVTVDWTGSSPQVDGGINSPLPFTRSCAYTALRSIMDQDVPNCHGYTRAITVTAPPGSINNPVLPGACGARGITGYRMIDCLYGALAQAVPHKVCADGSGGTMLPTISGWRGGRPIVFCECMMGSCGAAATHDGQEGVPHVGANVSNVPVEMIEAEQPLRIEQYSLMPDTGGAGTFRGGLSVVRDYRVLAEKATLNVRSDKRRHRPFGLFGGGHGGSSWNILNPGKEDRILPTLPMQPISLQQGDLFHHITAGGGGYGDPLERDPQRVLEDVIEEKITIRHAEALYGVVVRAGDPPTIDGEATVRRRRTMQDR